MGSVRSDEVANELSQGKVFLTDACDKGGRPLMCLQVFVYACELYTHGQHTTGMQAHYQKPRPGGIEAHGHLCTHTSITTHECTQPHQHLQSLDTMVLRMDPVKNPDGKICVLVDMANVGYSNLDAAVLRVSFAVLANYYPERLHAVWFYDAPTIFWGTWKLVTPFLDPVTRQKVHFVYSTNDSAQKLWEEFDR